MLANEFELWDDLTASQSLLTFRREAIDHFRSLGGEKMELASRLSQPASTVACILFSLKSTGNTAVGGTTWNELCDRFVDIYYSRLPESAIHQDALTPSFPRSFALAWFVLEADDDDRQEPLETARLIGQDLGACLDGRADYAGAVGAGEFAAFKLFLQATPAQIVLDERLYPNVPSVHLPTFNSDDLVAATKEDDVELAQREFESLQLLPALRAEEDAPEEGLQFSPTDQFVMGAPEGTWHGKESSYQGTS